MVVSDSSVTRYVMSPHWQEPQPGSCIAFPISLFIASLRSFVAVGSDRKTDASVFAGQRIANFARPCLKVSPDVFDDQDIGRHQDQRNHRRE